MGIVVADRRGWNVFPEASVLSFEAEELIDPRAHGMLWRYKASRWRRHVVVFPLIIEECLQAWCGGHQQQSMTFQDRCLGDSNMLTLL